MCIKDVYKDIQSTMHNSQELETTQCPSADSGGFTQQSATSYGDCCNIEKSHRCPVEQQKTRQSSYCTLAFIKFKKQAKQTCGTRRQDSGQPWGHIVTGRDSQGLLGARRLTDFDLDVGSMGIFLVKVYQDAYL